MDQWLSATGQCVEFGYVLRATAADLVISYGPLHRIKVYSKNIFNNFYALDHSAGSCSVPWAIAQYFIMRYRS
jgi:hypothetical protein